MQKLSGKLKNTPRDVKSLLVSCSVNSELNKDQSLSVQDIVRTDNNPEGVLPEYTQGVKSNYVYVVSLEGKPLMPCSPAKAKHLLKAGKAKPIKSRPFTIKLNFVCDNQVQETVLGIDSGYINIGFSIVSEKKELICGELKLDNKMSKRLIEKSMYRRVRRNKLWYRQPRFENRTKKEGWLPPSIERKYQTHLNLINRLKKMLPVSKVVIEVANFDIQKIMNPEIQGVEYQQGGMYDYQNLRSYLMAREKGKCQLCGKDFIGQPSHIHHCKQRKDTGSDSPKNLALLHKKCHDKLHEKGLKLHAPKDYKPNTFMSIIHKRFWNDIPDLKVTYGYKTFIDRNELNLEKTHYNDAFVVAGGKMQDKVEPFYIQQRHRHNRCLQLNRKGFKLSAKTHIYKIQPCDLVKIKGKWKETQGIHNKGKSLIINKKSTSIKKVGNIINQGSFIWRRQFFPRLKSGVSLPVIL